MDDQVAELSAESLEIVRSLMLSADPPEAPEIEDRLLANFAVGLVTPAEHERVVDALTRSEELRSRVLLLRREAISRETSGERLLAGSLAAYQSLRDGVANLVTPAARAALREIGRRLAAEPPTVRWATVRAGVESASESWPLTIRPRGPSATLTATLGEDGTLVAVAEPASPVSPVTLTLRDPVFGGIPLARASVEEGVYRFVVKDFGAVTGIARISPSMFALDSEDAPARDELGVVLASTPNGVIVPLQLIDSPQIRNGILRLRFSRPPDLSSSPEAWDTELRVIVGSIAIPIRTVSTVDPASNEVSIEAHVGDAPDGIVPCGSIFRLSFIRTLDERPSNSFR